MLADTWNIRHSELRTSRGDEKPGTALRRTGQRQAEPKLRPYCKIKHASETNQIKQIKNEILGVPRIWGGVLGRYCSSIEVG